MKNEETIIESRQDSQCFCLVLQDFELQILSYRVFKPCREI